MNNLVPLNPIAIFLFFGLQTMIVGTERNRKEYKVLGGIIVCIGWILNFVAVLRS